MRLFFYILLLVTGYNGTAQTLGGAATYNFLKLPPSVMQSAAGGVNVSMPVTDAAFYASNPALLTPEQHTTIGTSFNAYFKETKAYTLTGIYHVPALKTTFGAQIFFLNYGAIPFTDAAGNEEGLFQPKDYYIQASAARQYGERWHYGINIKWLQSNYGAYRSSALLTDVGLLYHDTAKLLRGGLVVKNMGVQLKTYQSPEDLPFDLQIGFTKRLAKAPFGFSVTAQQAHRFDIVYDDTLYTDDVDERIKNNFGNKLFNHFVAALHIYAGDHLEVTTGYNRLRRTELNQGSSGNGLNGFSAGFTTSFKKMQLSYARSYYTRSFAYNQMSIQISLAALNVLSDL